MMRSVLIAAAAATCFSGAALAAESSGPHHEIERQKWPFAGFYGQFDKGSLQRGFQIYKDVCANCHGLKRVKFRNLVEPGGPEFPEEAVKALAAEWPNKITDGPNDEGKMFERPARLADAILGPYKNDQEARSIQNGALPPDLSLIAKARGIESHAPWYTHILHMARDIATGYQEAGSDYLYALLTGYHEPPAGFKLADGMNYNVAFPGNQIAMTPPIAKDNFVKYQDETGSLEANSRDVTAFLTWAADPTLEQRKRIGWQVMLYLLITTVLLYLAKKRIWSNVPH